MQASNANPRFPRTDQGSLPQGSLPSANQGPERSSPIAAVDNLLTILVQKKIDVADLVSFLNVPPIFDLTLDLTEAEKVFMNVLAQDPNKFSLFPENIKNNTRITTAAFLRHPNHTDIVLTAVRQNGLLLQHAGSDCKRNFHIALAAVQQNSVAIIYVSQDIQTAVLTAAEAIQ